MLSEGLGAGGDLPLKLGGFRLGCRLLGEEHVPGASLADDIAIVGRKPDFEASSDGESSDDHQQGLADAVTEKERQHHTPSRQSFCSAVRRLTKPGITRPPALFHAGIALQAPRRSPALARRATVEPQNARLPML